MMKQLMLFVFIAAAVVTIAKFSYDYHQRSLLKPEPMVAEKSKSIPIDDKPVSVYKWQDAEGKWHFTDSPPQNQVVQKENIQSTKATKFEKSPTLTVAKAKRATSGKHSGSTRKSRCSGYDSNIEYYDRKARASKNLNRKAAYRQKRRDARWEKQKNC